MPRGSIRLYYIILSVIYCAVILQGEMGTPGGRGKVSDNRYILLAGMEQEGEGSVSGTPRRQLEMGGERTVSGKGGKKVAVGQGGKRTLDERSPGMHDQSEKVVRQRRDGESGQEEEVRDEEDTEDEEMGDGEGENERSTANNDRVSERNGRNEGWNDVGSRERRVDEFMLGEIFHKIEEKFSRDVAELVKKLPEGVRGQVKDSMGVTLESLKGMMSGISDAVSNEGHERRRDDAEMAAKIEELRQEVKAVKRAADNWAGEESVAKVKESEKEMERKVKAAECQLKYLDIDIGYATEDRRDMVRQVVNVLRGDTCPEERNRFDRIMRKTRIVLLGKKTESRREKGRVVNTVPVLLELQSRQDTDELEMMLRKGGYFAAFHWPSEMREFVGKIREGLVGDGYGESHFIRIRPEEKGGEVLIREDVRLKNGGKFQTKGFWKCLPAEKAFWGMITGMYAPLSPAQLRR